MRARAKDAINDRQAQEIAALKLNQRASSSDQPIGGSSLDLKTYPGTGENDFFTWSPITVTQTGIAGSSFPAGFFPVNLNLTIDPSSEILNSVRPYSLLEPIFKLYVDGTTENHVWPFGSALSTDGYFGIRLGWRWHIDNFANSAQKTGKGRILFAQIVNQGREDHTVQLKCKLITTLESSGLTGTY